MKPVARINAGYLVAVALATAAWPGQPAAAAGTSWDTVYSADLPTYARHLREEGFPEEVIGLLVTRELNQRFAKQERALQPTTLTVDGLRNFWSQERRAESRLLRVEKQMLARAVLGTAPGVTAGTDWIGRHLAELSARDRDLVRAITGDYDDLIQRVRDASRGYLTGDDRDAILYLEGERAKDLATMLDRDQLTDFEIQHTAVGDLVVDDLSCFEPKPAEMRDYYRQMVAAGVDRIALEFDSGVAKVRQWRARVQAVDALINVWPPDRIARLRFSLYFPYRQIYPLVHRLGLTTADADAVLASLRELMDPIGAMQDQRPQEPDTPARRAKVIDMYQRHCAAVRAIIGDDAFDDYHELFSEVFSWLAAGQLSWMPLDLDENLLAYQ